MHKFTTSRDIGNRFLYKLCKYSFAAQFHVSGCDDPFQSLAQMKVGHRHCVPFSFSPLGPSGRGQIQKARPRFMPGFFVVRLMHGSWWLSQSGRGFLVKSLDQSSLLAAGSITASGAAFVGVALETKSVNAGAAGPSATSPSVWIGS